MSDYMLEKKPGQREIHTLCIIGKVAAEFNTCLKFFIGKQAMHNFEDSHPCDEQHGSSKETWRVASTKKEKKKEYEKSR